MLPQSYEPADLDRLERRLGVTLPALFRGILQYPDTHDRYRARWLDLPPVKEALEIGDAELRAICLGPVDKIIVANTEWFRREHRVRGEDGRPIPVLNAWIRFGSEGSGDLFFLDTSAEPFWILRWDHEDCVSVERVVPLSQALADWVGLPGDEPPAA